MPIMSPDLTGMLTGTVFSPGSSEWGSEWAMTWKTSGSPVLRKTLNTYVAPELKELVDQEVIVPAWRAM